jgi:hypothetical protein
MGRTLAAVPARRSSAQLAVVVMVVALAACTGSSSTDDPGSATSTTAEMTTTSSDLPSEVQEVGEAAGCDGLRHGASYQFGGRSEKLICSDDDADVALIHSFDADRRQAVESYLKARTDRTDLNPCPDGTLPPGPWILVGLTWAASSYDEGRIRAVASAMGGEFVGGGATPDDPPVGPPASYMVPGVCDSPPTP